MEQSTAGLCSCSHVTFCLCWHSNGSGQGVFLQCIYPHGGCTEHQCSWMQPHLPVVTPRIPTFFVDVGLGLMLVYMVTQTVHSKAPRVWHAAPKPLSEFLWCAHGYVAELPWALWRELYLLTRRCSKFQRRYLVCSEATAANTVQTAYLHAASSAFTGISVQQFQSCHLPHQYQHSSTHPNKPSVTADLFFFQPLMEHTVGCKRICVAKVKTLLSAKPVTCLKSLGWVAQMEYFCW